MGLLDPDNGFDVLQVEECSFCDRLTLIELRSMLTTEHVLAELKAGELQQLEVRMLATDEDIEDLRATRGRVNKRKAE